MQQQEKKKNCLRVQLYNQKLKLSTSKPQETLFLLKFKLKFIVKKMPKKVITIIKVTYTTEQACSTDISKATHGFRHQLGEASGKLSSFPFITLQGLH